MNETTKTESLSGDENVCLNTTDAKRRCTSVLSREEPMLVLFSGDQRLTYEPDQKAEQFGILPKYRKVIVPLGFFSGRNFSETRLLFHLYETLALYPDWCAHPELYLGRAGSFRQEAEEMTTYLLRQIREAGLQDDPLFSPDALFSAMKEEILAFIDDIDLWTADLIVLAKAPVYANPEMKAEIASALLMEDRLTLDESGDALHKNLGRSLLVAEWYGVDEIGLPEIRNILTEPVMGIPRFTFLRDRLREMTEKQEGGDIRDRLIRTFLLPSFIRLWKMDADRIRFDKMKKSRENGAGLKKRASARHDPSMSRKDRTRMLKELKDQKERRSRAVQAMLGGDEDLRIFGVTSDEQMLFRHYEGAVRSERERMKQFWRKLIGEGSRIEGVKIEGVRSGKLNVNELIRDWPSFEEAERQGNYRDLTVFDAYELRKMPRRLPRYLDLTFVIDNSGSMKSGKIEAARRALTIVFLSLQDFADYLEKNAAAVHQRMTVRTETWLFGTSCRRVLSFDDAGRKKTAGRILSVTRLDGSGGSTDDGQCLKAVLDSITPKEAREQAAGQRIRLVFEVTDGASSFPGAAKDALEKLKKKHVEVHAIEIGLKGDEEARRVFQYVFGDHGLFLGDETDRLPEELLGMVKKEVGTVFRNGRPGT